VREAVAMIEAFRAFAVLLDPWTLLGATVVAGAIAVWFSQRLGAILAMTAAALVVTFGILPGAAWLALPLESRFPSDPPLPEQVAGIIALGGTERLSQSEAWKRPILNDPSPIAAMVALGRRYPQAKLIFSGGTGARRRHSITEAEIVRQFLMELGLDAGKVVYEEKSRDTFENALLTRDIVRPQPSQRWILVTQAISLPRAVAVFRHLGWDVIPFPAGYLSNGEAALDTGFHLVDGLNLASVAIHEWGGLLVYRLLGYSDELFPR
jgi:uncharacterized SAM-binding protein YcdF (DUF218 family)